MRHGSRKFETHYKLTLSCFACLRLAHDLQTLIAIACSPRASGHFSGFLAREWKLFFMLRKIYFQCAIFAAIARRLRSRVQLSLYRDIRLRIRDRSPSAKRTRHHRLLLFGTWIHDGHVAKHANNKRQPHHHRSALSVGRSQTRQVLQQCEGNDSAARRPDVLRLGVDRLWPAPLQRRSQSAPVVSALAQSRHVA